MAAALLFALLVACSISVAHSVTCPPAGFDSIAGFNLQKYIQGEWYIQEQMVTAYQRENQLYCVRAKYVPNNPSNFQAGFQVINSARQYGVTGTLVGSSGSGATSSTNNPFGGSTTIMAYPNGGSSPTSASKLKVGPSFLAPFYLAGVKQAFGPYWVVAAGLSPDGSNYDWAIVSGGPPKTITKAGCAAGPLNPTIFDTNGAGLWLFSRKPLDPTNTALMRTKAQQLGFDISVLKKVQQQGCTYPSTVAPSDVATIVSAAGASGGSNMLPLFRLPGFRV